MLGEYGILLSVCTGIITSLNAAYRHTRLEVECLRNKGKLRLRMNNEANIFSYNSTSFPISSFHCHLELSVPSSQYGFSVFIEEMSMSSPRTSPGCRDDYLQFGRDILFVTTHLSRKYCGVVEPPVTLSENGIKSFKFPSTPLSRRIYNEEDDREMDIWIVIDNLSREDSMSMNKSLTLVVTPFKKSCRGGDTIYRQCQDSNRCVRRDLFCDGRVNCALPYRDPADEAQCRDIPSPQPEPWSIKEAIVIVIFISSFCTIVAIITWFVMKFRKPSSPKPIIQLIPRQSAADLLTGDLPQHFLPTCPPLHPPPYTPGQGPPHEHPVSNNPPRYEIIWT